IGGLFLLGIIAVGGIVYWVYQNKAKWVQSAEQLMEDAKKFGVNTNNEGCLKEALSRHKRDKSITAQISTNAFLGICLQQSEASPGFCDGVPAKGEIMKSANWTLKKCSDAGLQNDRGCQQIFGTVQAHCHGNKYSPEN
ncbi:MAG: hypothetical protein ACREA2_17825, partial [Blastocatellia bacterium]